MVQHFTICFSLIILVSLYSQMWIKLSPQCCISAGERSDCTCYHCIRGEKKLLNVCISLI